MNWEYILAIAIVLVLGSVVGVGWRYIGVLTQGTKWERFYKEVNVIVNGVEQLYKNGTLDDRLGEATATLQKWLDANGLKIDASKLRMYIEAEVGYLPPTHEE